MDKEIKFPSSLLHTCLAVDQQKINRFAELSSDYNPIHTDPEFAKASSLGGIIAHGSLSLGLIWNSIQRTLPDGSFQNPVLEVRFKIPAYLGDDLKSGGALNPDGLGYDVWVSNQNGYRVLEGVLSLEKGMCGDSIAN